MRNGYSAWQFFILKKTAERAHGVSKQNEVLYEEREKCPLLVLLESKVIL